ncbi:MAG TPA: hypothetical protein VKQ72_00155 [Aggregatilineales bacterium]|nr:hypothetical protein [Aggregatilineales bacterium]
MAQIFRTAWDRWQIIARINGDYIARLVVNLFYFTIMVPFALGVKFLTDPLALHGKRTAWLERKAVGSKLTDARSQF